MALRGCLLLSKRIAFFFNFLIWLTGIVLLCGSIYLRMDPTFNHMITVAYPDFRVSFQFFCYFFISLSIIITLIGFVGCCSIFQESHSLLGVFISCLVIFLMAQMASACWLFIYRNHLKHSTEENIRSFINTKYGDNVFVNEPLDHLQITFKCCGSKGPSDFWNTAFNNSLKLYNGQTHDKETTSEHHNAFNLVPSSCCGFYAIRSSKNVACVHPSNTPNGNNNDIKESVSFQNKMIAYNKGCKDSILSWVKFLVEVLMITELSFVAVQLLSLTLSIILCCSLKRNSAGGYK